MIHSLARAGAVLGEERYISAAAKAAEFIWSQMRSADGRLQHSWRGGQASLAAYLDDYACLANGMVTLHQVTCAEHWIDRAVSLVELMIKHFVDAPRGGFYYTADDHESLITRIKDLQDSSTPSGNAMAATVLARLGILTGRSEFTDHATRTVDIAASLLQQSPQACGQMLVALDWLTGPATEFILVGDESDELHQAVTEWRRLYQPTGVFALRSSAHGHCSSHLDPLFAHRESRTGDLTLYVCRDSSCQPPVVGLSAVRATWAKLTSGH